MRIDIPSPESYQVDDYDFTFTNGLLRTLSIAKSLGDTVDFDSTPLAAQFHFSEKSSPTDPDGKTPSEDVTVMMQHVITVDHRTRLVTPPTQEQKHLFQQTLQTISKTVQ